MKHILHRQAGTTLIELLIVMAMMSMFVLLLTDILTSVGDIQKESEASSQVAQDGRYIVARLTSDIHRATSITTPAALGASSVTLVMVIGGVNHTYAINSGNLQLTNGLGTNNLNGSETTISALSLQKLGNAGGKDTIRLSFTVTAKTLREGGVAETKTYTTTVGKRT